MSDGSVDGERYRRRGAYDSAMKLRFVALAVVALVLGACSSDSSASKSTTTTAPADFYAAPPAGPSAAPGTVIRTEAVDVGDPAVRAFRVMYHSRTIDDRDIAVTGLVFAPASGDAPSGGRPVVSWAHGTTGLADKCAPSKDPKAAFGVTPAAKQFLDKGYVVAATDYQGLGGPGLHPYLVGAAEARGTLDIARAAQHMDGLDASKRVVVYGHSQGGHATLFAGQIASQYAPDLEVLGVSGGAPVGNLTLLLPVASSIPEFLGYVIMGGFGFNAAYPEADPAAILTPSAYQQAKVAVDTVCADEINRQFDQPASQVITQNPSEVPPWPELLAENSPGNVKSAAPVQVWQGSADQLVPIAITQDYVKRACALGSTVQLDVYEAKDHGTVVPAALADIVSWTEARFAGTPAPSTC